MHEGKLISKRVSYVKHYAKGKYILCMYIMYVCMYIYVYIYTYTCTYMYMYILYFFVMSSIIDSFGSAMQEKKYPKNGHVRFSLNADERKAYGALIKNWFNIRICIIQNVDGGCLMCIFYVKCARSEHFNYKTAEITDCIWDLKNYEEAYRGKRDTWNAKLLSRSQSGPRISQKSDTLGGNLWPLRPNVTKYNKIYRLFKQATVPSLVFPLI